MTANLLSRLQGLTAPDREADADIFQLLGGSEWDKAYIRAQEPCGCPHDLAVSTARERYSPAYTSSLDATVALCERVLPGWKKQFFESFEGLWIARVTSPRRETYSTDYMRDIPPGGSPNGAIALLIAILTALEARDGKD